MAKVVGPLFSISASGNLSDLFTYHQRATDNVVTRQPKSTKPHTALQLAHQTKVAEMRSAWNALNSTTKATYKAAAPAGYGGGRWFFHQWFAQAINPPDLPTP